MVNLAVLGPDWQLVDLGLVFYRNRIGMSFSCQECGLVVLNCFQNHFYEENKHAIFKSNIFPLLQ